MRVNRRRSRPNGSLATLRRYLWSVIDYNLSVVEDPDSAHEDRRAAGNALVQAGLAYIKVTEVSDVDTRLKKVEALVTTNGHAR